jgi:putative MFS transporter
MQNSTGQSRDGNEATADALLARLQTIPPLPAHWKWAALIGAGCFLDGFTILTVAAALTVLIKSLHIGFAGIGLLISAPFFGMLVGAIVFGALSERWGRRAVFAGSVMLFGALSLACAGAWSYSSLFWIRVAQGLALGGAVPVAAALIAECLPASVRGKTFSLTYGMLFALGYLLAPLAGLLCIAAFGPAWGWRSLFLLAGLALPFGIILRRQLPESPRWLILKGRFDEANRQLSALEDAARSSGVAQPQPQLTAQSSAERFSRTRLAEIFEGIYFSRTILIWILFFAIYFLQYGLNSWLPTLYVTIGGLKPQFALGLAAVNGCVTLLAALLFSATVDRMGRKRWFEIGFLLCLAGVAWGILAIAWLHWTTWPALFSAALPMTAGIGVNAGSIYLYAPELFPTRMRAWATSTGSAASRVGSIVAPLLIGISLQARGGLVAVLGVLGVVCVAGLVVIATVGIETKRRTLEELAK